MPTNRELMDSQITEADWQKTVIDYAHMQGWIVAHFRPARTEKGWRTAVSADGKGFPDLVLVRPPRVIFSEIKGATGELSYNQIPWWQALAQCPGIEYYVWRPRDWGTVQWVLARKGTL